MFVRTPIARALITTIAALALVGCIPTSSGGNNGNNGTSGNNGGIDLDSGGADGGSEDAASDHDAGQDSGSNMADTAGDDGGGGQGAQGLQGYCEYYKECGGSSYEDADACVQDSLDYWGDCRQPELDAFGNCMMGITCDEWGNPDAYNPNNTDCADEWDALRDAGQCQ